MSSSGEEDYHSAEEERGGGSGGEDDTDIAVLTRGVEGARLNAHGDDSTREVEARSSTGDGGARDDEGTALFDTAEPVPSGTTDATVKLEEEEEQSSDDNRSPGPASEEMAVELTEEEIKERKEKAGRLKAEGNDAFKRSEYAEAVQCYTEALKQYPPSSAHEVAVCHANRAACHLKLDDHQSVVDDCSKALELKEDYLKAYMRRAQAYEALEKYEDALEDYKKALELDPSQAAARQALMYLPEKIKEQQEKLKAEMLGKLKELGNAILNPFGLSTDNFQFQQDPNSGGYSVNFNK